MNMSWESKTTISKAPLFVAMGVLTLGLAACDSKPTEEQASRSADPTATAERTPAIPPTAAKDGDVVKKDDNKDIAQGGHAQPMQGVDDVAINIKVQDA